MMDYWIKLIMCWKYDRLNLNWRGSNLIRKWEIEGNWNIIRPKLKERSEALGSSSDYWFHWFNVMLHLWLVSVRLLWFHVVLM
jgi:hypothetical protein